MLFERWREIADAFASQIALHDLATGKNWTFEQLDAASESPGPEDRIRFPHGHSADFIIDILRAWRMGCVTCPLEIGHEPPGIIEEPPPRIVHLKTTSATTGPARLVAFTAEQLNADVNNI